MVLSELGKFFKLVESVGATPWSFSRASFASQGVSLKILLVGSMELDHPLSTFSKIIWVQRTQKFDQIGPYKWKLPMRLCWCDVMTKSDDNLNFSFIYLDSISSLGINLTVIILIKGAQSNIGRIWNLDHKIMSWVFCHCAAEAQ